ncbi:MAG TPA: M4 family metallopeptidase [Saprospiraceae bacterium]|nr:M4 family metallopeptidase [Saprospiraceae bacterium]
MKNFIPVFSFLILFLACSMPVTIISGQNNRTFFPTQDTEILSAKSQPGFFHIRDDVKIDEADIFTRHPQTFGLSAEDHMTRLSADVDKKGNTHTKYQQYFKGLPVETGLLITHINSDKKTYLVNGQVIRDLNLPAYPLISEEEALQTALDFVPAKVYLWEDPQLENLKKENDHDSTATHFPKGRLCIFPTTHNPDFLTQDFSLGWQFDIYVKEGGHSTKVYVDALDGLVKNSSQLGHECAAGSGNTTYNGNQTLYTKFNGTTYNFIDDCQATLIRTYDAFNDTISTDATHFSDANNVWDATNQRSPAQTHFSAESTYDYYANNHSRYGWDGSNASMNSFHGAYGVTYANACWDCWADVAIFGIGPTSSNFDDWNTLDIVGHEFTHGVVKDEINSPYSYEQGALNESFADIFGEMVEQTTEGWNAQTSAWLVGEDKSPIRDFETPGVYNHPDTYKGTNWFNLATCAVPNSSNDNCGVHTNSGVQNHWFYILAHGETNTNDNGDTYSVSGLGIEKARDITYDNLTYYMTPSSGYLQARNGSIQSAEDLYGVCSNEAIQTAKAWYAVGADVDHTSYNAFLNCFNITSSSGVVYIEGIESLRLSHTVCGFSTITSTIYDIYLLAGKYVDIRHDSKYAATGTSAVIIAPNDCSFTVH